MRRWMVLLGAAGRLPAQTAPPRFQAILQPVNVKADIKLFDIHFVHVQLEAQEYGPPSRPYPPSDLFTAPPAYKPVDKPSMANYPVE